MSDFENNWGGWGNENNNDQQSWQGHQNEESENNQDNNDDTHQYNNDNELDVLLREDGDNDNSQETEGDNTDGETHETSEDDRSEEGQFSIEYESIKHLLTQAPTNTRLEKNLGDRDVYNVINIVTVLDMCPDDVVSWIEFTLGINGKDNIRRALNIVKMEKDEFHDHSILISAIKDVYNASTVEEGQDPMSKVLEAMKKVQELDEKQRGDMLALLRKMMKSQDLNARVVSSTRNSSSIDIVQDIRKITVGEDSIAGQIEALGSAIETIWKIVN